MTAAKESLNIALVGPAHPLRGGIADFNEALARSLQAAGHRVKIFSFRLQYPAVLFPGKSQFSDSPAPDDLEIETTISSIGPRSWFSTAESIRSFCPDLVIIRYWLPFMAPSLGTIARSMRKQGIPVIAITDNVVPHERRPGDNLLTRYFIRSCDGFVAMSRSVIEDLGRFTESTNRIFQPHPVYDLFGDVISRTEARRRLSISADRPLLLFFGFIRPYKGLMLLLEAMTDARIRRRGVQLIVAGEFYESEQSYRDFVKAHGLGDSVRFDADFIPKPEVAKYFCAADMVVQPYISATQSGITQIAYHFGCPMLVTNVGGLSEIVDHGKSGYVVKVDAGSIAAAIDDFYENDRHGVMSSNVLAGRSRFSWSAFTVALLELHAKILARRP